MPGIGKNSRHVFNSSEKHTYPVIRNSKELSARDPLVPAYVLLNAPVVGAVWKLQRACQQRDMTGALARSLEELLVGWEEQEQEMMERGATTAALIATQMGLERDKRERKRHLGLL